MVFILTWMSYFGILKEIHIKKCPSKFYIRYKQHFTIRYIRWFRCGHKLLVFLKLTPTQSLIISFTLGTFSDFVMVENTLSFPDLILRYSTRELSRENSKVLWQRDQNSLRKQTTPPPRILKKSRLFFCVWINQCVHA